MYQKNNIIQQSTIPYNFNKDILSDSKYKVTGGMILDNLSTQHYVVIFIILILLYIKFTDHEFLYFYIPGCSACIAKDKTIDQPQKYLKVDLTNANNDTLQKKAHYVIGNYIMGIDRAPTIVSKLYM